MAAYRTNLEHLQDELRYLDLLLGAAIARFRQQRDRTVPAEFQGFYISDTDVDRLVTEVNDPAFDAAGLQQAAHWHEAMQERIAASEQAGLWLPLPHLSRTFSLSPFEQDVLLLALAPELDQRYRTLYAYLQDNVERKRPTVDLALGLFCQSLTERVQARMSFTQDAPLLTYRLLHLQDDPHERSTPLLSQGLRLDSRLVQFLLGDNRLDARLTQPLSIVRWVVPTLELKDLVLPEATHYLLMKLSQQPSHQPWLCLLHGPIGVGKKACAEAIAKTWQKSLLVIDLLPLLKSSQSAVEPLELAWREAHLYGNVIYLDNWQAVMAEAEAQPYLVRRWVEAAIARAPGLVCLGSQHLWHPPSDFVLPFTHLEIPLPDEALRQQLWGRWLQPLEEIDPEREGAYLANAFRFGGGQMRQAIAQATSQAQLQQQSPDMEDLVASCRFVAQQRLIRFAQRLDPKRRWEDLVLPADLLNQLRDFCRHLCHRTQVYGQWGFGQKLSLGKGLVALFTGASGTGKTLSAEVLATETGLDLYRVDLAAVVSKYIGETEKNLSQVFQDAQTTNAILFFDEADALFGKRSDIKDAHDRYANIEVNYLLQQVEDYEGAIILASNFSQNIDEAFLRRLQFKLEFPFPNERLRLAIWQRVFPAQAPLAADINCEYLAKQFKLAGGNIKNVALAAAFQAAEADSEIGMTQIILGVKREYQKLGKVCEKADFGPYYELVR